MRKAAVLVASLDPERGEAILAQMSPAQAEALRVAVADLGPLDPVEQAGVIEEFFRIGPLLPDREPSGIELDDPRCAELAVPQADPGSGQTTLADPTPGPPLRLLHEASAEALSPFLEREHPQTIAVVVSHLSSARAAEVLAGLPDDTQVEVAQRLVDLDETDPQVLCEIERGLETWLTQQARGDRRRAAGMTALVNILDAANARTREHILANLGGAGRPVAGMVACPPQSPVVFADVEQLDGASLAVVLDHAGQEVLILALAGAPGDFAERALDLLPRAKAQVLRRALCNLGPTRLSDMEEAQQELARLARNLEQRGDITRKARRHLSVAV
jgi:flagellar motor switch protein FliG